MTWCPRHSWSEDRPCHTSGAWALDSLLQLLSSPCFPLMGRGSPDCLWNIREWQFHRLFWQQNEKSEDIILLPKARVSPLNTHTHTHTHKEANLPMTGVSCRQTLKTAINRFPQMCYISTYKGKVPALVSACRCNQNESTMTQTNDFKNSTENSEATQAPALPSSSTILTIKTTHTETKPQKKIKWWLMSIPIWLTVWLTNTANQPQHEGEY